MNSAYVNAIATAVPEHDVHAKFIEYCARLLPDSRTSALFRRMANRAQIEHRYSILKPGLEDDRLDESGFYRSEGYPGTATRMAFYERHALPLACRALGQLDLNGTSHLITTTCTGFYAPGLDHQIIQHYGLSSGIERTAVGFMGCFAALNALKLARHIVRAEPDAKVLIVNLELCTLHLQREGSLEEMLSFLIFADGCAASLVTSQASGLALEGFSTCILPESQDAITWRIGDTGFDMHLCGQVPAHIAAGLPTRLNALLDGRTPGAIDYWAIHPGGRTVLDAVREGAGLEEQQLLLSREVLRRFGNMSSASIMFVLQDVLQQAKTPGAGCAMAFGPGLTVEGMRFAV